MVLLLCKSTVTLYGIEQNQHKLRFLAPDYIPGPDWVSDALESAAALNTPDLSQVSQRMSGRHLQKPPTFICSLCKTQSPDSNLAFKHLWMEHNIIIHKTIALQQGISIISRWQDPDTNISYYALPSRKICDRIACLFNK